MINQTPGGPEKNPETQAFEALAAQWSAGPLDTAAEISVDEEPIIDTDRQTAALNSDPIRGIAEVITHPGGALVIIPLPEGGEA